MPKSKKRKIQRERELYDADRIKINTGDDPTSKECHYCGKDCKSIESRIKHVERCMVRRKFCKHCGQIIFNLPTLELHETSCDGVSLPEARRRRMGPFSHFYYRIDQKAGEEPVVSVPPEPCETSQEASEEDRLTATVDKFILEKASSSEQIYICGVCEDTFTTRDECRQHTKEVHKDYVTNAVPPTDSVLKYKPNDMIPVPQSAKHTPNPRLQKFSKEQILAKLLERQGAFVCKCGILFRDRTRFYLHRGIHHPEDPFKCAFCGHVSSNWYDFNAHLYFHKEVKKSEEQTQTKDSSL